MRIKTAVAVATVLLALGCGDDDAPSDAAGSDGPPSRGAWVMEVMDDPQYQKACAEVAGCGETRYPAPGGAETIWRIQVIREATGEIRFGSVDAVTVPEGDGVPLGSTSGPYVLAGLDGAGQPVDGQLIRFPEMLRVEFEGGGALPERIDLTDRRVDTIGFVRADPAIESFAVVDEAQTVHATQPIPTEVASALLTSPPQAVGFAKPAWAAVHPWNGLPPYCSHVLVLEGEADRDLASNIAYEDRLLRLVKPGPWQLALTKSALGRMTPLLCQGIRRIAFGYVAEDDMAGAVRQSGTGDMMLINVPAGNDEETLASDDWRRLYLQVVVLHEAGHATEALLNAESSRPEDYAGAWSFPARTLASKTIDHVRLEKGLKDEWTRMHDSFVDLNWAEGHQSSDDWPRERVVHGGFMTHYGATSHWDDIAEFVAYTYMTEEYELYVDDDRLDIGCTKMQRYYEENLPARFSAAYTKLLFLRDLGLVAPQDVDDCLGPSLGLHIDTEGFQVWQETMRLRSFPNNVKAGIGTIGGNLRVFELEATGEANFGDKAYPTTIKLRLDLGGRLDEIEEVSWPRGAYKLGLLGNNKLLLRLDGAPAGDFDAMDGYVLVAEASNDRIAGSIVLQRVFRLHAPLPVPEKYDPPLVFRFLIEHG